MITHSQIQQVSDEIARRFHPDRIILFGSYAYGTPTEDSDVDLLVVMPFEGRSVAQSLKVRQALDVKFPMDLIVHTPQHVQQRLQLEDFFLRDIVEKGRVLYEADHAGVG